MKLVISYLDWDVIGNWWSENKMMNIVKVGLIWVWN